MDLGLGSGSRLRDDPRDNVYRLDPDGVRRRRGDGMARFVGVVAIVTAASSIAVPVFHRMSDLDAATPIGDGDSVAMASWTVRYCALCGSEGAARVPGEVFDCGQCRARTVVELAEDTA